jgi:hypothetical protein
MWLLTLLFTVVLNIWVTGALEIEFLTHWWAHFPTGYCPIDRASEDFNVLIREDVKVKPFTDDVNVNVALE